MTLDRFIHRVRCFLSPKYREERRQATIALIEDLKGSRQKLIEYIEQSLLLMEHHYGQMCRMHRPGDDCSKIEAIEVKLVTHRQILEDIKTGKRIQQVDIDKLKQTLSLLGQINEAARTNSLG
jgi:hypothetical protein